MKENENEKWERERKWKKREKKLGRKRMKGEIFIFLCSQHVPFKFPMGSHQVPKMFPKFPMCSPRLFPIPYVLRKFHPFSPIVWTPCLMHSCVYFMIHITKLQLQTTFPKPLYIWHSACIHWDPGRWKSWCLHCLWPVR
jgi:hypothetical protein